MTTHAPTIAFSGIDCLDIDVQVLSPPVPMLAEDEADRLDLKDIKGQESARRALEVTAAGGHNVGTYYAVFGGSMTYAATLARFGLTAVALVGTMSIARAEEGHWNTYGNARFGYSLCYPPDIFIPQGEADNGDGQRFVAADGAELLVWGSNNVLDASLDDEVRNQLSGLKGPEFSPSYRAGRGDWRVVSGMWGKKTLYLKVTLRRDQFVAFRMSYDRVLSETYDTVVKRVSSCLLPADGRP